MAADSQSTYNWLSVSAVVMNFSLDREVNDRRRDSGLFYGAPFLVK